jgi:hypothetical protein
MSTRNVMTHRCDIQRNSSHGGTPDGWGNEQPEVWSDSIIDQPCYFWFGSNEGAAVTVMDGQKAVLVQSIKMVVPLGTNVTEDDRVENVRHRHGAEIMQGPLRIDSVMQRADHVQLALTRVSS